LDGKEAVVLVPRPLKFSVIGLVFEIEIWPQPVAAENANVAHSVTANTEFRAELGNLNRPAENGITRT
jgi:hypothetical protein